jgi:hypothetical protein
MQVDRSYLKLSFSYKNISFSCYERWSPASNELSLSYDLEMTFIFHMPFYRHYLKTAPPCRPVAPRMAMVWIGCWLSSTMSFWPASATVDYLQPILFFFISLSFIYTILFSHNRLRNITITVTI